MDFLISSFYHEGSKHYGELFYSGSCARATDADLRVAQSADWRFFGKYDETLAKQSVELPIEYGDFFFSASYNATTNIITMQTDLVGYEAVFYYRNNDVFCISDDVIALAKALIRFGVSITVDELKAREYVFYSECFFEDTVLNGIYRMRPASIVKYSLKTHEWSEDTYDSFKMTGDYSTVEDCANSCIRALNNYFERHKDDTKTFAVGMSGGLDSRVCAYIAKEHGYRIKPIFIGRKRNIFGMKTNDVKRAEAVNKLLALQSISFIDPRYYPLKDKVEFDSIHAPNMTSNIPQNIGRITGFDVLMHAMMGGEAFGALYHSEFDYFNEDQLANHLAQMEAPGKAIRSSFMRRVGVAIPQVKGIVRKLNEYGRTIQDEIISEQHHQAVLARTKKWVHAQKELGLDNANIAHKYFYYRFAVICKTGYYSTVENTSPSLAAYMNPVFIKQMLKWDSSLLAERQVQKRMLQSLGALASLRSQTTDDSIQNETSQKHSHRLLYVIERGIRGGAMTYDTWFSKKALHKCYMDLCGHSSFGSAIDLTNHAWFKSQSALIMRLLKVMYIESDLKRCSQANRTI